MSHFNLQVLQDILTVPNWVAFKFVPDAAREGHMKKLPFDPRTGRGAKANDSSTWATYEEAYAYAERNGFFRDNTGGIGFEFSDGYAGIDLDNVVLPDGSLKGYALDIVRVMDSYTEYSPSGKGLHILFKLTGGERIGTKNDKLGIEFYNHGRYFTVTGRVYGEAKSIRERTKEAKKVFDKYFIKHENKVAKNIPQNSPSKKIMMTDKGSLLYKIFEHDNTGQTRALWGGDISAYGGDHSSADLALCNILAWWTNGDASQIDSLFRESGLMRPKWDERRGSQTYGEMTISKAIERMRGNGYTVGVPSPVEVENSQGDSREGEKIMHEENQVQQGQQGQYNPPITGFDYITGGKFESDLEVFRKFPEVYTGFRNLDEKQGKLAPGLYVLGAVPSLGKTSFCLQMADNIAKGGNFVLYFALEQNRLELTTKSLSRLTAQNNIHTAISSMNIRRGDYYNEAQREAYDRAVAEYKKFSRNIAVIELGLSATISTVTKEIKDFIEAQGLRPVVFVDYLQIIRPDENLGKYKQTNAKEFVDDHVRILKKLQSDSNLVMVLVCSFNRANYSNPVDFESFKETGSIEYTADVLWGMQLQVVREDNVFMKDDKAKNAKREEIRKASKAIPRKVMIQNLKNRYGKRGYSCGFIYDCRFDYFVPDKNFQDNEEKVDDRGSIY